jgi:predicted transcriptional regulator
MTDDELKAYLDSLTVSGEPETHEERLAWSEGLACLEAGRVVTHDELLRSLGITREGEPVSGA